jgi:hypothetical protein
VNLVLSEYQRGNASENINGIVIDESFKYGRSPFFKKTIELASIPHGRSKLPEGFCFLVFEENSQEVME